MFFVSLASADPSLCAGLRHVRDKLKLQQSRRGLEVVAAFGRKGYWSAVRKPEIPPKFLDCRHLGRRKK